MKFNSLVLITIFFKVIFAYAIELIQFKLFFAKTLAVYAVGKKYNPGKITVNVLEDK